jgi:hypothetical protein
MTTLARTRYLDVDRARRLRLRHLWLVPGLGLALFANAQAAHVDLGLVPLLVFGIVPHLTVLLGIGQSHAQGQLAPRAVPLFNVMHEPALPLAVLGLAAAGVLPSFWLVGALAWLSHIVVDLGFGNGLRTADGFLRGRSVRDRRPNRGAESSAHGTTAPRTRARFASQSVVPRLLSADRAPGSVAATMFRAQADVPTERTDEQPASTSRPVTG